MCKIIVIQKFIFVLLHFYMLHLNEGTVLTTEPTIFFYCKTYIKKIFTIFTALMCAFL